VLVGSLFGVGRCFNGVLTRPRGDAVVAARQIRLGKLQIDISLPFVNATRVSYKTTLVGGFNIFNREAGDPAKPAILLLHGFPTSSHMFRDLIPHLAEDFHVIAPDLPGFGHSDRPGHQNFRYTFDHLVEIIGDFVEQIGLKKFAVYIFDYGAPVGLRLALRFPERISALISQNGNAYVEGISDAWEPWKNYWKNPTPENREACREALSPEVIRNVQYLHGTDARLVSPDGYTLDIAFMARPGADEAQLDLILDYRSNVALYPEFQEFFRQYQPPTLAVWGKNDPFFIPLGAEAYKRDNPKARVVFYDTGHFALETHAAEIGQEILGFLKANL
jgi:pimeloyl-ACP methyl ester carboxylesterase